MKVLMFGWEFPPHIAGGLGTACSGLTKGLKAAGGVEVVFVVPKAYGDENQSAVNLIGANHIPAFRKVELNQTEIVKTTRNVTAETFTEYEKIISQKLFSDFTFVEVASLLVPYLSPEQFEYVIRKKHLEKEKVYINKNGKLATLVNQKEHEIKINYTDLADEPVSEFYNFTGNYGPSLMHEVAKYAEISGIIAERTNFDVIHAHDWLTYAAGVTAKQISGKPLVIHVHATEFDRSGENINQQVYDLERFGMEHADRIITVSNLTKKIVIERYGINADKITTVYNAVEPAKAEKQKFQKHINDKIVTFLGRITYQKGPEYFIEAAYKVIQKMHNVQFVMAGSGDLFHKMIRRAAELKISDRFHFTDFLKGDEVKHMFAISDVYVMPSVSEPFGISPLEAMSTDVPVIISKQSGVAEILKHAVKVDFWDVNAIADSIYGLLNYQGMRNMFVRYGRAEVESLKWENAAMQVKKIYAEII